MNAAAIVHRLDVFASILPALTRGITAADARWRPASGAWSILEIVRHLGDEEVEDFRSRLRSTLEDPSRPWGRNDPEAWARDRRYNEGELGPAVERFVAERRASIAWLRSLAADTDWSAAYQHRKVGPVSAGDLLASWAAHDALHVRKIAKRLFELAGRDGAPFSTRYAGEWGA